jgi:hypothetical protein
LSGQESPNEPIATGGEQARHAGLRVEPRKRRRFSAHKHARKRTQPEAHTVDRARDHRLATARLEPYCP